MLRINTHSMSRLLFLLPGYRLTALAGRSILPPLFLTVKLLHECNQRCSGCRSWTGDDSGNMSMKELESLCRGIGFRPFKVTVTGGEPFLHPGIMEFLRLLSTLVRPHVLVLPTNGSMPDRVREAVDMLAKTGGGMKLVLNFSVDGPGDVHDRMRGSTGSFDRVLKAYESVATYRSRLVKVGFNITVLSGNFKNLGETCRLLAGLKPDHIVMEPAAERSELFNAGSVSRVPVDSLKAALMENARFLDRSGYAGRSRLHRAARLKYYRTLDPRDSRGRCHAGAASVYIHPDGRMSPCPVNSLVLGDLRNFRFDLRAALSTKEAARAMAAARKCDSACTLADAFYFNGLFRFPFSGLSFRSRFRSGHDVGPVGDPNTSEQVGSDAN